MTQSQFSLSWDAHKKNICHGLSTLQQNGEFVDMTLAADGHSVKVHQIILALASPYIKDLIASAQCTHPIIFLSKISYTTLCSILEYIYTGEVVVRSENLHQLIEAGKELHIKGLEDMKMNHSTTTEHHTPLQYPPSVESQNEEDDVCFFEITNASDKDDQFEMYTESKNVEYNDKETILDVTIDEVQTVEDSFMETLQKVNAGNNIVALNDTKHVIHSTDNTKPSSVMQYTVSNQGSLQMILNRFVYYLKHTNRNNSRKWRCVDYVTALKCPAQVVTKDDIVIQRLSAHTHPFHDKRILKKLHAGSIFSAIQEAEKQGTVINAKKVKTS